MAYRLSSALAPTLLVAVVLSSIVTGQDQTKLPLTFGSEINVVAVPVFVTDKDGKTVAGLTAADFQLFDAGKPVPIDSFLAISADKPVGTVGDATAPSSRRQFLLLFDLDFSRPDNVERARRGARQFVIKSLAPGDLVAVGTVNATGFRALLGFTTDKRQAVAAIDGLGLGGAGRERDPLGLVYDAGLGATVEGRMADATDSSPKIQALADELRDQAVQLGAANRRQYTQHVEQFLAGFQSLARTLDSIKGRAVARLHDPKRFDVLAQCGAKVIAFEREVDRGLEKAELLSGVVPGSFKLIAPQTAAGA